MVNEVWESPCLSQFCRGSQGISSIDDLGGGLTGKNWFPLCTPSSPNTWACSLPHHFCYQKDLGRDNLGFYNLPALSPWLTPHGAQEQSKIPLAWPEMLQPNGPIPTFPSSCANTVDSLLSALPCRSWNASGSLSSHGLDATLSSVRTLLVRTLLWTPVVPLVCSSHLSVSLRFAFWGFTFCGFAHWGQLLSKNSKWKIPETNNCVWVFSYSPSPLLSLAM